MIREMGNFEVTQRTKDSMFNATELLRQWNKINPGSKKEEVQLFFNNDKVKQFIETLKADLNGQEITHLTTRGKNGGTWMHPYLFIDFAMWINPKFKLDVIKFVYDQLIEHRHSAGDMYRGLTNGLKKFKDTDYVKVAKALNWIVFDKHEKGIRQTASQEQLKELTDLQKTLSFALDMGYIKSYNALISEMRRIYNKTNSKF